MYPLFSDPSRGEPPLMLAISVYLAIRDAIGRLGNGSLIPNLNAPATPEAILMAVEDMKLQAGAGVS